MSFDVKPYAKAVTAAVVAGASFAIPVVDDGLIASEVLGVAVAALTAFGTVWAIPNRDPKAEHQDESAQPPEAPALTDPAKVILVDGSQPLPEEPSGPTGYGSGV